MADNPVSPIRAQESATTREEPNFDDTEHESGTVSPIVQEPAARATTTSPSPKPRVSFSVHNEEIPPQKPPRPNNPQLEAESTLIEAFPTIDVKVVRAVLTASGGKVEPAFNALLSMSDPDFQPEAEEPPPTQPPRPTQRAPLSQLEADEQYARQLAEQYDHTGGRRAQTTYNQRGPAHRGQNQQRPAYDDEPERSFFDDDLPEIGRNIQQGFQETQKKFNSWINNFRKKIDGEDDEDDELYTSSQPNSRQNTYSSEQARGQPARQNFGASTSEQLYGIRKAAEASGTPSRRSTEAQRYDADPHELGDDAFERLELRDDEATPPPQPPRTSSRQKPHPDLFKTAPVAVDEVEAAEQSGKSRKWQALTALAPAPEDDNDPFSVGDDDDEGGAKSEGKGEEVRKEDTERLKAAARGSVSGESPKTLQEHEKSGAEGTRDKAVEELLTEKKA